MDVFQVAASWFFAGLAGGFVLNGLIWMIISRGIRRQVVGKAADDAHAAGLFQSVSAECLLQTEKGLSVFGF